MRLHASTRNFNVNKAWNIAIYLISVLVAKYIIILQRNNNFIIAINFVHVIFSVFGHCWCGTKEAVLLYCSLVYNSLYNISPNRCLILIEEIGYINNQVYCPYLFLSPLRSISCGQNHVEGSYKAQVYLKLLAIYWNMYSRLQIVEQHIFGIDTVCFYQCDISSVFSDRRFQAGKVTM